MQRNPLQATSLDLLGGAKYKPLKLQQPPQAIRRELHIDRTTTIVTATVYLLSSGTILYHKACKVSAISKPWRMLALLNHDLMVRTRMQHLL